MKCMGGVIQGRLWPQDDDERQRALDAGHNLDQDFVLGTDDLVTGDDCFFVATGITDGELMRGVRYRANGATTDSLVMRSRSGTIRRITSEHQLSKLRDFSAIDFDQLTSTGRRARVTTAITRGSTAIPRCEARTSTGVASGSMHARQSTMPSRLE